MKLPNGFGSIHLIEKGAKKKRRKPYRARVVIGRTEKGNYKYLTVGYYETQQLAYEALKDYHNDPALFTNNMTIAEIYEHLCKTAFGNLSDSRKEMFDNVYRNQLVSIHNMNIKDVRGIHLERLLTGISPNIQKVTLTLLKKIYNWAERNEFVTKNIANLIDLKEIDSAKVKQQESRSFTDDEILNAWKMFRSGTKTQKKNAAIILLMLYTGIRASELETLMRVGNTFVGGIKTENGKNRTIPIHPDVEEVIPYVNFKQLPDTTYDFCKKHFKHKLHDTRHSFTTYMRRAKASESKLRAILGHDTKNVTDIYDHTGSEDLDKEILLLGYPKC